jgi:hypothetical protein
VTKLCAITSGDLSFWAFDRPLALWLRELIDVAEGVGFDHDRHWMGGDVAWWRVVASVEPYGLELRADWTAEQRQEFLRLARDAPSRFQAEWEDPGAAGMLALSVLDSQPLAARHGLSQLTAGLLVELGRAVEGIGAGTLLADPPGGWWLLGFPPGRSVVPMRGPDT